MDLSEFLTGKKISASFYIGEPHQFQKRYDLSPEEFGALLRAYDAEEVLSIDVNPEEYRIYGSTDNFSIDLLNQPELYDIKVEQISGDGGDDDEEDPDPPVEDNRPFWQRWF